MKILHVFYSTLPNSKGGDIRSRDVVESQLEVGLDVLAVSSPFQPPAVAGMAVEEFGGVRYFRTYSEAAKLHVSESDQGLGVKLKKLAKIFKLAGFVHDLASREKVSFVHAHSTFFCAAAAYYASRRLGVPFLYEVRSLWEERAVMKAPTLKNRFIAGVIRLAETAAMRAADHVVVISEGLKAEALVRGVPASRITVVGNGASLSRIPKVEPTVLQKASNDFVFGYIGSLSEIEGLDLLLDSVRRLREEGWENKVVIYGDGPAKDQLVRLAKGIPGVEFKGAFAPADAAKIYQEVDVVVNPRRRSRLTDRVTPLKPLEAMAYRKPVIVSSVEGMLELVKDGVTGFVFESDNSGSLKEVLKQVTDSPERLERVVCDAYEFVSANRSWRSNGIKYKRLYESLIAA